MSRRIHFQAEDGTEYWVDMSAAAYERATDLAMDQGVDPHAAIKEVLAADVVAVSDPRSGD